jgi:hypothetical protein
VILQFTPFLWEYSMTTLADLMRIYPLLCAAGSEHGMDRYETEYGNYICVCPDCGYIADTPDLGCGNCGFGTVMFWSAELQTEELTQ